MEGMRESQSTVAHPFGAFTSAFTFRRLALVVILGVVTWAVLIALFGGSAALDAIASANGRWLLAALVVHYASFGVRGHRWRRLLDMAGHRLGYWHATSLLIAGWFVSALLPARAGDLLRVGVLRLEDSRRAAVPVGVSLGSIVSERALDILAILVLGAGFGWAVLQMQAPNWLIVSYAAALALLAGLMVAILAAPTLVDWLRTWSQRLAWQKLLNFVQQTVSSLRLLAKRPRTAVLALMESLLIWLSDALVLWFVILSLDGNLPFGHAAFVALTVDVLAAAPLTPGGVGQIDAAYVALFALTPMAGAGFNVGAAVLLVRFITYWSFLLFSGAVAAFAGFGEVIRRLHNQGATPFTGVDADSSLAAHPSSDISS
uniref:Flippase-like domain-containing protein n=1 Tax=Caldilinea aerophila TaxID=133453 RepID=A0A7C1JSY1_9CHLR